MRKLTLKELNRISVEAFRQKEKIPVIIVLDNVRSGLNVGSAFRTADAFALAGIYLCGITAQPPHREILKTAIGATEAVHWKYFDKTEEAVVALKEEGFRIVAIEQAEGSTMLQDFEVAPQEKLALVFGNEVKGVGEPTMALADTCLEIPQFGTKHSLNVSVSLGIVVWEIFKQMGFQK